MWHAINSVLLVIPKKITSHESSYTGIIMIILFSLLTMNKQCNIPKSAPGVFELKVHFQVSIECEGGVFPIYTFDPWQTRDNYIILLKGYFRSSSITVSIIRLMYPINWGVV